MKVKQYINSYFIWYLNLNLVVILDYEIPHMVIP